MRALAYKLLWLLVLLVSGGMFVVTGVSDYLYPVLGLFIVLFVFTVRRLSIPRVALLKFLVLAGLFVALAVVRGDLFGPYALIFLKMVFALLVLGLLTGQRMREAIHALTALVEALTALSLLTWLVSNAAPSLLHVFFQNELGAPFGTLGWLAYFRMTDLDKFGFLRNQSVFWEPGVFSVVLIVTFSLKRYLLGSHRRTWLYALGVASSASFGGIMLFFPMLAHSWLAAREDISAPTRRVVNGLTFSCVIFAGAALVVGGQDVFSSLGELIGRDVGSDGSILVRGMDLKYGFQAAMQEPWLGHGMDFSGFYQLTANAMGMSKESYGGGITNSITSMAYQFGIVFTAVYLFMLWRSLRALFRHASLYILLTYAGCLVLEPLFASVLFLILVMYPGRRRDGRREWSARPVFPAMPASHQPFGANGMRGTA